VISAGTARSQTAMITATAMDGGLLDGRGYPSASRSIRNRSAPSAASASAIALPIPDAAPVTTAFRPRMVRIARQPVACSAGFPMPNRASAAPRAAGRHQPGGEDRSRRAGRRVGGARPDEVGHSPGDRGRRIDPVDRPRGEAHQPVQQQRIVGAGEHHVSVRRPSRSTKQGAISRAMASSSTAASCSAASASAAKCADPTRVTSQPGRNPGSGRGVFPLHGGPRYRALKPAASATPRRPA